MNVNMIRGQQVAQALGNGTTPDTTTLMTLTVQDLARELQISRNTAYMLTEQKGFPVFRVGKRKLINREMLQVWMNQQCSPSIAG